MQGIKKQYNKVTQVREHTVGRRPMSLFILCLYTCSHGTIVRNTICCWPLLSKCVISATHCMQLAKSVDTVHSKKCLFV